MLLLKISLYFTIAIITYSLMWLSVILGSKIRGLSRVSYAVANPRFNAGGRGSSRIPVETYSDTELIDAVCNNNQVAIVHLFYKKYLPTFQYHIYKLFPYKEEVRDLVDEFFLNFLKMTGEDSGLSTVRALLWRPGCPSPHSDSLKHISTQR